MGGSVYPVNYVPEAQMGGSLPGATGHMYARYEEGGKVPGDVGFSYPRTGEIPSNGPGAKKTMASAQDGLKKFKLKDERDLAYRPAESTNVKKKNFDLEQDKERKNYLSQLADQQKENSRRKKLTQDQREREDYNARNEERGSIQAHVPESTWDRSKAIASNPLTAFGYAARNESLPARFQYGERNTLDNAIDWVNPLQGVAALSEIPGELGRGEFLNAGLSALDAADLGVYAKGAMKASKPLLQKTGKALGTESGLLSNAYKYNPWAFKSKPEAYYRQIYGEKALDSPIITRSMSSANDPKGISSFVTATEETHHLNDTPVNILKLPRTSTSSNDALPYFNKGEKYYGSNNFKDQPKEFLLESNFNAKDYEDFYPAAMRDVSIDPSQSDIANKMFGDVRVLNPFSKEGHDINNYNLYKKDWLQGYKKVPKQEEGGVIKDDRGQWDHPGEITEIGSNEITMQGVPYDVLGISDTGDTKLMKPGKNYKFKGKKVTEYPMAKNGLRQEQKGLQNLDNLTNFTNYNKPTVGGWLNKYN